MSQRSSQLALRCPRVHRWVVAVLLPVLLFAQEATAFYLCPRLLQAMTQPAAMPLNCDSMGADPERANLCQAHCDADAQASSATSATVFVPALLVSQSHPRWQTPARRVAACRAAWPNAPPRSGPALYLLHMVLRD